MNRPETSSYIKDSQGHAINMPFFKVVLDFRNRGKANVP